jgi:DNA-binding LytR/AlgR family response regulator
MLLWDRTIPDYLTERKNVVGFILFTAGFALLFINMYAPFGVDKWLNVSDFELFFYSSIVILIGILVIVLSRVLMYLLTRKRPIRYGEYAMWIFGEIFCMALVYALIQKYFILLENDFMVIIRNSLRITAYIILLPYVISWLYLAFRDKYLKLERLSGYKLPDEMAGGVDKKSPANYSMVPFTDEKGMLRFSIKKDDLLYLEAADNYVIIHYLDNKKPVRYMVRNTLKRIETEIAVATIVRCHRSYMVNIDNVKVIRKEKEGLIIGFDEPVSMTLPISKTYLDGFIRKLSHLTIDED